MITAGCVALFLYVPAINAFFKRYPQLMFVVLAASIVLLLLLICIVELRRTWPMNIIVLVIFTILEGLLVGSFAVRFDVSFLSFIVSFFIQSFLIFIKQVVEVLIVAGMCVVIFLALTIFSFQTKVDFTAKSGILVSFLIVLLVLGVMGIFVRSMILQFIYCALGALVFSAYIVFDTQLIIGGKHENTISPEEYIFASLSLYLDVINVFMFMLSCYKWWNSFFTCFWDKRTI